MNYDITALFSPRLQESDINIKNVRTRPRLKPILIKPFMIRLSLKCRGDNFQYIFIENDEILDNHLPD